VFACKIEQSQTFRRSLSGERAWKKEEKEKAAMVIPAAQHWKHANICVLRLYPFIRIKERSEVLIQITQVPLGLRGEVGRMGLRRG